MYKLFEDYHTHTFYSDGKQTIEDIVKRASELGLKTIGISDHGFNKNLSGITRENVKKSREEIIRLQALYPNIKILLGVEANLLNLDGDLDLNKEDIKLFDYIIFGIHYFTFGKGVKGSLRFNLRNFFKSTKKYREKVTDSYIKAIQNYPVKVVVHPNYVTPVNIKRLAEAAKEKGVMIELNGKRTTFSEQQTKELIDSGVDLIIGTDAHTTERVGDISVPMEFIQKNNIPINRVKNLIEVN